MYPNCETVEYASTRLISFCTRPMDAAKSAVRAPTIATTSIDLGASTKRAFDRATIYTPAVTMVAAWMRAETGVGPSMASGSQMYRGICADLPQAPMKSRSVAAVMMGSPMAKCPPRARVVTSVKRSDPKYQAMKNIPRMNAASPMRLTMKALAAASLAELRWK